MSTFDISPFYRSSIGFDRLLQQLDGLAQKNIAPSYPPCNIEKLSGGDYRLTMAVAGFSHDELIVEVEDDQLTISGQKDKEREITRRYLHRGIAERVFQRRFSLAEYMQVRGANLENGLLHIHLERELPETMKARTIKIVTGDKDILEQEAA